METTRTVVIHDDGNRTERTARRLCRVEPTSTSIVVVTHRSVSLPGSTSRRVQVIRERTPRQAADRVQALLQRGAILAVSRSEDATTISACIIAKNEESVIGACLMAITPFVDEVVVYDTGSSDATREIAREAGATVVEGYWDDHFGDARNRAMQHCTMAWLIFVDADEVATGKPSDLRERLRRESADVVPVTVVSTSWTGGTEGEESVIRRVCRRTRVAWTGRLHEYMRAAAGVRDLVASMEPAPVQLLHSGYQEAVVQQKRKGHRNADLARAELEGLKPGDDRALAVANYGRSLLLAGPADQAIAVLDELKSVDGNPTVILAAARAVLDVLIPSGQVDAARSWFAVMERHGESRGNLALRRASACLAAGDIEAAEEVLAGLPSPDQALLDRDPWGAAFDAGSATSLAVSIDMARGRADGAEVRLREQVSVSPEKVVLSQLLSVLDANGSDWTVLAQDAPPQFLEKSLRDAIRIDTHTALRWCDAFITAHPGDHRPVVAGCVVAGRADLTTAITWAAKGLEAGLQDFSPLRSYADQPARTAVERATALVVLSDAFADHDALADLVVLIPALDTIERADLASRCGSLGIRPGFEDATVAVRA